MLREGKQLTLKINVKPLPKDLAVRMPRGGPGGGPAAEPAGETYYSSDLGLEVRNKESLAEDAYADFSGVVVDRVDPDGLAAEAGIGPGMLIRKVGRTPVGSIGEFATAVEEELSEAGVLLQIRTSRGNAVVLLKKE